MPQQILKGLCPCCQRLANVEEAPFGFRYYGKTYIMARHRVIDDNLGTFCEAGEIWYKPNLTIRSPELIQLISVTD